MPPPNAANLANTMYLTTGGLDVFATSPPPAMGAVMPAGPIIYRNEHIVFPQASARRTYAEMPNPMNAAIRSVAGALNAGGDWLYLPFTADRITSMRIPSPPPVGVTFFCTANLSGCRFFIDSIPGSNDLIVYHANTTAHTGGANAWADFQTLAAGNVLDQMRANARADAPYAALHLAHAASVQMSTYFQEAGQAERRKGHQGLLRVHGRGAPALGAAARTRPVFQGGCFICGFYNGGWQFWYQSFGAVAYTRPGYFRGIITFDWMGVHKRRTQGGQKTAGYADWGILRHVQFH